MSGALSVMNVYQVVNRK